MKMKRLLKSLASVFLALSSLNLNPLALPILNLHSSVRAWDNDMAFHRPINILVIGEPESGKSKVTASILRNLRGSAPNLSDQVPKDGIAHDKIYASLNNSGVRVLELDVEEFLGLENRSDRDDKYLIENISWVFYVCRKGKDDPKNLLRVYNTINRVYCRKYHVSYPYGDDCKASKQNSEWFRELENLLGTYGTFCKFIVIANAKNEEDINEEFREEVSYLLNGREIYYGDYPKDDSIPVLPDELLDRVLGLKDSVVVPFKNPWSYARYVVGHCGGWRYWFSFLRGVKFFEYEYTEPKFLKNEQDKNQDKNNEFWESDVPSALGTGAAFGAALAALYGTGKAIQVGGKAIANKLSGNNKNKNPEIPKKSSKNHLENQEAIK